jgi:hypothetical protein
MAHKIKRHRRLVGNDTLVSGAMLTHAVDAILKRVKVRYDHDIPYLAGYSRDGKTIYIDRHVPRTMMDGGRHRDHRGSCRSCTGRSNAERARPIGYSRLRSRLAKMP